MNIVEIFQLLSFNAWFYGGVFILLLSLLVFVHEMGHYLVARWCGVRVETFSIGFGKEIFGWNDNHGTRWKLSLVPLGGYVKLYGDTDPASMTHIEVIRDDKGKVWHKDSETGEVVAFTEDERSVAFFAKPVAQRAAIVFAGPAINYLFAILIFVLMFTFQGQPVTPPSVAAVIQGSSADEHGFQPHDLVLEIDDKKIESFEDIRREMMVGLDRERHFVVERDGLSVDIFAQPKKVTDEDRFGFKHSRGLLGVISARHAVALKDIRRVDNVLFTSEGESDADVVRAALLSKMGQVIEIDVRGPGADDVDTLTVEPIESFNEDLRDPDADGYDYLVLAAREANILVPYSLPMAFVKALEECWVVTRGTVEALGQMVSGTRSASELGGVIRIGALAGDMAQQGLIALIFFGALLSINLGLINLFPIPLLDGGHLLFYAIEAVLRRPVPERVQEYAFRFGLAFLVCIMVYANLNDVVQLIL